MHRSIAFPLCLVTTAALADAPKPPPAPAAGPSYSGLGAESVSSQDIAKYAPPALDDRVSRRIQALLDVRGSGPGLITSKGDRQIFASSITGTQQVYRQDGAMRFPIQLTGGEDQTRAVALAPDDSFIVVSRDVAGQENPGLYLLSLEGGPLRLIQHVPKVQTSLAYVSDDARSLYIKANDKDPASYAFYRHDLKTDQRELVFDANGLWTLADHRGDATWLLIKRLGSAHDEVYEYDLKARTLTPLLGQGEVEEYGVAYGARPGQLLVYTNKLGEFSRLYSLENGKLTPISGDIKHDVDSFAIDDARQRIYYQVNDNGYTRLAVIDARTYRPLALPRLPAADNVSLGAVSHNGRYAELSVDGSTLVPQTVTYDWQTGRVTTWRAPSTPEIDPRTFAKASLESYPARDGTRIPMFVWRPAKCDAPCAVVVDFHGGPEGQATAGYAPYAQIFVDAGFTFVQPNVRGSTGYGKAWQHADDGTRRLDVITDIEDAAKFIRTSWGKDGKPPRIGVTGGSYGGYAALMAMTYFAGAYDAGVEEVGISNLITFLMNTAPYRRILRISEYGDPVKDHDALVKLSPITHVAKLRAPLMLIMGVNDPRVPVGEGLQIHKQLEQRKIPSRLILFPDEGHGPSKRGNVVLALGHTVAFFEKHLLGR